MIENAASNPPIQSDVVAADTCSSCMIRLGTIGMTRPKLSASSATVASTSPIEAGRAGLAAATRSGSSGILAI